MTHRYGNGTSAADYLEKAQLEAYESHRAMFEACTIDQTRPDQTRPDQTRPDQTRLRRPEQSSLRWGLIRGLLAHQLMTVLALIFLLRPLPVASIAV
jgi:hypothetical protein